MSNLGQLIHAIKNTHSLLQKSAVNAVNVTLTIRNWLVGFYIVEYEQNGQDRADYGAKLLKEIASKIKINGLTAPELSRCRQFYKTYPQIFGTLSQNFKNILPDSILGTLSQKSLTVNLPDKQLVTPPEKIISNLSFSHVVELLKIEDSTKRTFYELQAIKGVWSVRELRRQINSLFYERSGLSKNPNKLSEIEQQKIIPQRPTDIIKNIYAFDFLDLPVKEIVEESDIEKALLDNLQQFILELGYGFCFEARQKRILIGEKYYFIDLLFYHRILKCHVLIDLKIGEFEHGDIGQLNTYLNYFKSKVCEPDDNSPVGILLVAEKDKALVEFATGGMDKNLFIQKYLLKLPDIEQLKQYIEQEIKEL